MVELTALSEFIDEFDRAVVAFEPEYEETTFEGQQVFAEVRNGGEKMAAALHRMAVLRPHIEHLLPLGLADSIITGFQRPGFDWLNARFELVTAFEEARIKKRRLSFGGRVRVPGWLAEHIKGVAASVVAMAVAAALAAIWRLVL